MMMKVYRVQSCLRHALTAVVVRTGIVLLLLDPSGPARSCLQPGAADQSQLPRQECKSTLICPSRMLLLPDSIMSFALPKSTQKNALKYQKPSPTMQSCSRGKDTSKPIDQTPPPR